MFLKNIFYFLFHIIFAPPTPESCARGTCPLSPTRYATVWPFPFDVNYGKYCIVEKYWYSKYFKKKV